MIRSALIFISVAAGVAAGYRSGHYTPGILMIAAAVILRLYIAIRLGANFQDYNRLTRLHLVWPCLLLAGAGALSGAWGSPYPRTLPLRREVGIVAEVTGRRTNTRGERYDIKIEAVSTGKGERIECRNIRGELWASAETILETGDVVSYRSVINRPERGKGDTSLYYTYDVVRVYENRVDKRGREIYHYRDGGLRIVGRRNGLMTYARIMRDELTVRIERAGLSDESAQLLRALLTGKRIGVRLERLEDFRDAGVAHTLAVSGMHIGILAGMLLWLTLPLNLIGGRRLRFIITLLAVWSFAVLTGLQVSILRSALMLTLVVVSQITDRRRDAFGSLCVAGIIILLIWPESLWDVAFQLSFSCVGALCLLGEALNPVNLRSHPVLHRVSGGLIATVVATGATWVISAYYFGSMPLNFIVANIIVIPFLPLLMGGGIMYMVLESLGIRCEWMITAIDSAVEWLYRYTELFRGSSVSITPSLLTVWIWMAGVVMLCIGIHRYRAESRMRPGALPLLNPVTAEGAPRIWWPGVYAATGLFATALLIEIVRFQVV